jgi:DNA repair protein RecO (recombination protein O)
MLQKSKVIILRATRYGDSSLILKTYSRQAGVLSLIASVSRKAKNGLKPSLLQPLNQLEIVYYAKSKGELKRLKEARVDYNYQSLPYAPVKSCLGLFLAETLQYVLQEEEPQEALYQFITSSFQELDSTQKSVANFHLVFLLALSRYIGFAPEKTSAEAQYFDMLEGRYTQFEPSHPHFISPPALGLWQQLQSLSVHTGYQLKMPSAQRAFLLDCLLKFYRLHVTDFGELKSLAVLHQVLH